MKKNTTIAIPPGESIREQMEQQAITLKEFASRMEMSLEKTNQLLYGKIKITMEIAVKIERILGVPAQFWLNLESVYREKLLHI